MFTNQSNTRNIAVYEPGNSSTAELISGYTFQISYNTGADSVSGDVLP